jgi:isoquinoline 1-oxidoreductase alpha subunit
MKRTADMATTFTLNGERVTTDVAPDTMLIWVLRDHFLLTGTKYGCGIGQCGSCTVHVDGRSRRACRTRLSVVANRTVTTIEGLSRDRSHVLQRTWLEEQVPQCGYCHSGQIMHAAALLAENPSPTREEIVEHMDPILCRCGTYQRIMRAIERAISEG